MTKKTYDAFISYSSMDKELAVRMCEVLEDAGIFCWIAPRNIIPGKDYGASIIQAIETSRLLIVIYSSHSNASPQVLREVERAVSKKVPVIPFRVEDVRMSRSFEYFLSNHHWIDAFSPPIEKHLAFLIESVHSYLDKNGDTVAPKISPEPEPSPAILVQPRRKILPRALVAVAVVCLCVLGYVLLRGVPTSGVVSRDLAAIVAQLHQNRIERAEELLAQLDAASPLYSLAHAALDPQDANVVKANQVVSELRSKEPELGAFPLVLQAQAALKKGELDKAVALFRDALNAKDIPAWQKADCYYGLGMIDNERKKYDDAVRSFDLALQNDAAFYKATVARGLALEGLGKPQEAVKEYQTALALQKGDPIVRTLAARAQQSADAEAKNRSDERIRTLTRELIEQAKVPKPAPAGDGWTSKPLSAALLDFGSKGEFATQPGEDVFLFELFRSNLAASSRVRLVERELLENVLQELKLGSSELADKEQALRVGRILSARVLLTGTVLRHAGQMQISLRAIDTETTRVVASLAQVATPQTAVTIIEKLSREIDIALRATYPLRGVVQSVQDGEAMLNIGRDVGVAPGLKLRTIGKDASATVFTVTRVEESGSAAGNSDPASPLKPGLRLEENAS